MCVFLQRQSGGVAMMMPMGQPAQLPAVCHPQQMYPPRALYTQDGTLQEVPNGPEFCPTGKEEWMDALTDEHYCLVIQIYISVVGFEAFSYTGLM